MTDDGDEKNGSLHVLSDEQLDHLASVYHPYSSETGTHDKSSRQSRNIMTDSLLY
jgi:hypothetical protein